MKVVNKWCPKCTSSNVIDCDDKEIRDAIKKDSNVSKIVKAYKARQLLPTKECSHPVHSNPGLIAPCPECGADDSFSLYASLGYSGEGE